MNEVCVICGDETNVSEDAPVATRNYYVDAAGQLCPTCFYDSYHPDTPEDIAGRALSDVQIHDVFKNPWDGADNEEYAFDADGATIQQGGP